MLPASAHRVRLNTSEELNRDIDMQTEARVRDAAEHPEKIGTRLRELDREWDIERMLEANAASLSLLGLALSRSKDRRFLVLPVLVAGFLLQHALQGWCPPVPILRRFGFRARSEIERERAALKALRGDFGQMQKQNGMGATARARMAMTAADAYMQ